MLVYYFHHEACCAGGKQAMPAHIWVKWKKKNACVSGHLAAIGTFFLILNFALPAYAPPPSFAFSYAQ